MLNIRSYLAAPTSNSLALVMTVTFFNYAIIQGSKFQASCHSQSAQGSLVEVALDDTGHMTVGKLTDIFVLNQPRCGVWTLGAVK